MPTIDLSRAKSYQELAETVSKFHQMGKTCTVNGSSVSNGSDSLDFNALKSKINQLYSEQKSSNLLNADQYNQLSALLFEIKSLSCEDSKTQRLYDTLFLRDGEMHQIETECFQKIHDNVEVMDSLLKLYDQLAELMNDSIKMGRPQSEIKGLLNQLKYLNSIIGLEWNEAQKVGKEPVPLWKAHTAEGNTMPKSMKIADCNRFSALNALLANINQNENVVRHRDKLVIPGRGEYSYAAVEQKIKDLAEREMIRFPFAKSEIAYEAYLSISTLKQMNPRASSEITALNQLETKCLNIIRQDPKTMKVVRKRFNSQIKIVNRDMMHSFVNNVNYRNLAPESMLELKFLGAILDQPLSIQQFNQQALIQPVLRPEQKMRLTEFDQYNTYRSLINHEIELREKIKEFKSLNWQIDPQNASSILLNSEQKMEVAVKINQLRGWICDKTCDVNNSNSFYQLQERSASYLMPEPLFQSMLTACGELAKRANKPLQETELKGFAFLPTIERKVDLSRENFFDKIEDANNINTCISCLNHHIKLRKLIARKEELRNSLTSEGAFSSAHVNVLNELSQLDHEFRKVLKASKNSLQQFSSHRELIFWMNETFIPYYQKSGPGKLSTAQRNCLEEIPLIDLEKIPKPEREGLLKDYQSLTEIQRTWIDMPESVREALQVPQEETSSTEEQAPLSESSSSMSDEEVYSSGPSTSEPEPLERVSEMQIKQENEPLLRFVDDLKHDLLQLRFLRLKPILHEDLKGKESAGTDADALSDSILQRLNHFFSDYNTANPSVMVGIIETQLNLTPDEKALLLRLFYTNMTDADFESLMEELEIAGEHWTPPFPSRTTDLERELALRYALLQLPPFSPPPSNRVVVPKIKNTSK